MNPHKDYYYGKCKVLLLSFLTFICIFASVSVNKGIQFCKYCNNITNDTILDDKIYSPLSTKRLVYKNSISNNKNSVLFTDFFAIMQKHFSDKQLFSAYFCICSFFLWYLYYHKQQWPYNAYSMAMQLILPNKYYCYSAVITLFQ